MTSSERRDEQLEQMLRQSAGGSDAAMSEACLDAETVAAWADGGLSGEALHAAELHAVDCARCQALVATLVRSAPPAVAAVPVRERWFRSWQGWLVPAMAAATVAIIWLGVIRAPSSPVEESAAARVELLPATAVPPASPASAAPSSAAEPAAVTSRLSERSEQGSAKTGIAGSANTPRVDAAPAATAISPPPAPALGNEARVDRQALAAAVPQAPPPEAAAKSAGAAEAMRASDPRAARAEAPAGFAAPAPPSPSAAASAAPPVQAPSLDAAAPAVARPAPAPAPAPRAAAPGAGTLAADDVRPLIDSADPAVRWRLLERRNVERSTDGGTTWQRLQVPAGVSIRSGSAPSAAVCWLVGEGGVVLRTTDGRSFQRIAFPERLDLVSVMATSPAAAGVVANGGRRFATTDGRTWTEQ